MLDIILSVLAVVVGVSLIFLALGELILRLLVALFGLWLINYGFKIRGQGSLYTRAYNWYIFRKF
jgi:hypothetical protein